MQAELEELLDAAGDQVFVADRVVHADGDLALVAHGEEDAAADGFEEQPLLVFAFEGADLLVAAKHAFDHVGDAVQQVPGMDGGGDHQFELGPVAAGGEVAEGRRRDDRGHLGAP